jgi:hypothetical protein
LIFSIRVRRASTISTGDNFFFFTAKIISEAGKKHRSAVFKVSSFQEGRSGGDSESSFGSSRKETPAGKESGGLTVHYLASMGKLALAQSFHPPWRA